MAEEFTVDAPADPIRAWVAAMAGLPPFSPEVDDLLAHLPAFIGIVGRLQAGDPNYGEATVHVRAGGIASITYTITGQVKPLRAAS